MSQASPSSGLHKRYHHILRQLDTLATLADQPDVLALRAPCSGWSVGQHVEHLARVGQSVLEGIAALDEHAPRGPGIKPIGRVILLFGRIPRGKGKAPEPARPGDDVDPAVLGTALDEFKMTLEQLEGQLGALEAQRAVRPHPYFGGLRPAQWLRFIEIHQDHHQRIIDDIRKQAA